MERSKAGTQKIIPDGLLHPNRNTIITTIINILVFYKIWKKYYEIQLTKTKMNFNNQKNTYPPSPGPLSVRVGKG